MGRYFFFLLLLGKSKNEAERSKKRTCAGKKKSGKTRGGNNYLKGILTEAAWAALMTKGTAISEKYHNIARRRGKKREIVAIGHQILTDVYRLLSTGTPYKEVGAEAARERKSKAREKALIKELERRGFSVQRMRPFLIDADVP